METHNTITYGGDRTLLIKEMDKILDDDGRRKLAELGKQRLESLDAELDEEEEDEEDEEE